MEFPSQAKDIASMGSNVAGWMKAMGIVLAFVGAIFVAREKLTNVEHTSALHTEQIQTIKERQISQMERLGVVEEEVRKQDVFNEKMLDSINNLNMSIVQLNTTIQMLSKQKGA